MIDPIITVVVSKLAGHYQKRANRDYDLIKISEGEVAALVSEAKAAGLISEAKAAAPVSSIYSPIEETGRIGEISFVESSREEEIIGQDPPKRCDNRMSKSETRFTIRASRRWRRQYVVQTDKMLAGGATASAGFNKVVTANLQLRLDQAMHETVSATDEVEKIFEQSFEVTVPPGVMQTVTLTWKKIWQVGYIKLLVDGRHVQVPYRVLEGIDYDQVHQSLL